MHLIRRWMRNWTQQAFFQVHRGNVTPEHDPSGDAEIASGRRLGKEGNIPTAELPAVNVHHVHAFICRSCTGAIMSHLSTQGSELMNMRARQLFGMMLTVLALALSACSFLDVIPDDQIPEQEEGNPGDREKIVRPDLAAAAEILGVDEEDLSAALGDPQEGPPDLAAAASELGVTEEALREALGIPEEGDGAPHDGEGPPPDASGVGRSGGL